MPEGCEARALVKADHGTEGRRSHSAAEDPRREQPRTIAHNHYSCPPSVIASFAGLATEVLFTVCRS